MTKKSQERKAKVLAQATVPEKVNKRLKKKIAENQIGEFRELLVEQLLLDPNQPRRKINQEDLADLAESIRSQNLQQAVNVTFAYRKNDVDYFYIKHGERRWRAHKLLGRKIINCCVLAEVYTGELSITRLLEQSVENFSRVHQSHRENIRVVQLVVEDAFAKATDTKKHGLLQIALIKVAKAHGKKESWALNYYTLSRLHPDLQEMLDHDGDEKLNVQVALSLARAPLEKQQQLLEEAKPYFKKNFHVGLRFITQEARASREANGEKMRGRQSEHKENFQKYAEKLLTLSTQFQGTATTVKEWNEYVGKMISAMSVIECEQMAATLRQAIIPFDEVQKLLTEKRRVHMEDLRKNIKRVV